MEKSTRSSKPDYLQVVLPERLNEALDELAARCLDDEADRAAAFEVLIEVLRSSALESWKNGLQAGRNRSRKQATDSDKSA